MARFFFYGTLLDADVQQLVFGHALADSAIRPAVLEHYRPARARGKLYPILAARRHARTAGVVVAGLGSLDVARLFFYEDTGYETQEVRVTVGGDRTKTAWVFIPSRRMVALASNWSLAEWQRRHKPRVLPAIAAMMRAFPGEGRLPSFRAWRVRRRRPAGV
jgi:hypothetical protein